MKKIILPLIIIFALILTIFSCKKNTESVTPKQNDEQSVVTSSNPVEARIISFKQSMENPLKIGREYSIDSAVWYSEALVNYTYADVRNNQEELDWDSAFINVPLTNGKISQTNLAAFYGKVVDSLVAICSPLPTNNHLLVCDIFSKDSTANQVTFGLYSAFAYGSTITSGLFGEEDWWLYGGREWNGGGYCGESIYAGTHTNDDAALQIARKIRLVAPGQRYTTSDVILLRVDSYGGVENVENSDSYTCVFNNPDPEDIQGDNLYDYLMFYNYSGNPNYHDCLSPDEMNFYLSGTQDVFYNVIYDCLDQVLTGKDFITIANMIGDMTVDNEYSISHVAFVQYGIWLVNNNEPEVLE